MNDSLLHLIEKVQVLSKGNVNFDKLAMYITTFHSTSIEGSTLTENEVINLLSYNKTAKKPMNHHLMVMDHYEALSYCVQEAERKKTISLKFIQELAALVNKNTGSIVNTALGEYDISKGELRLGGVFAGNRQDPDARKILVLLDKLILETNEKLVSSKTVEEQIKLAFWLHFEFVSIHPFGDGNGRVARLLMNYILCYFQLPMTIVFKQDKIKYIDALESSRRTENIANFYKFMFSQYSKFLKKELKILQSE